MIIKGSEPGKPGSHLPGGPPADLDRGSPPRVIMVRGHSELWMLFVTPGRLSLHDLGDVDHACSLDPAQAVGVRHAETGVAVGVDDLEQDDGAGHQLAVVEGGL